MSVSFEDFQNLKVTPWISVSQIPSDGAEETRRKLIEQYGDAGVYQVALTKDIDKIGSDFVHEDIGYTGMSKAGILTRTYSIRAPSGTHGAARYIREHDLDRETDVKIRYIYTEVDEAHPLEQEIQRQTQEQYGYKFKWHTASAGNAGNVSQILDLSKKLTTDEILDIIPILKQIAIIKNQEEFMERLNEV